jgi:NitT/TauT family transport system ATP-binding protein
MDRTSAFRGRSPRAQKTQGGDLSAETGTQPVPMHGGPAGSTAVRPVITIDDLCHVYSGGRGPVLALDRITMTIGKNEFLAIVGPSGCGKSTLMKIVAGLLRHATGSITLNGTPVTGPGLDRGVVFQQPALFPWMSVLSNVEFGLVNGGWARDRAQARAREVLDIVGLGDYADRHPYQLSGGQAQRVAVARAWAMSDTQVLLMDEPFAAVDPITKTVLQDYLVKTWTSEPRTVLYITHDIEEAVYMADRVALMNASPGRIDRIYDVELPRPRDRTGDEAIALRRTITARMKDLLGYT